MGTTLTKSIATRIPFDEYVRILQIATEMKVSMSDYIILKLHAADNIESLKNQIQSLQNDLSIARDELDKSKKSDVQHIDHIRQWKAYSEEQGEQLKTAQTQLSQSQGELEKCQKEGVNKQAKLNEIEKRFKATHVEANALNLSLESALSVNESRHAIINSYVAEINALNTMVSVGNKKLRDNELETTQVVKKLRDNVLETTQVVKLLDDANANLKQVVISRQTIIDGAKTMYLALKKEHNSSPINFVSKPYWLMIDGFMKILK